MSQNFRFDRVEVRPAERALLIDGQPVALGSRAFDVLQALIAHRDRVVTKDELLEIVWPGLVVEENNLQAQVSALRKLLGPKAIATIPGRGYQFSLAETVLPDEVTSAPVPSVVAPTANLPPQLTSVTGCQQLLADTDAPILTDAERIAVLGAGANAAAAESDVAYDTHLGTGRFAGLPGRLQKRTGIVAAITGIVIVLVGVAAFWNTGKTAKVDVKPLPVVAAATFAPVLSIIVLPFTNLTGDANQAYVADGLTVSLTADLSRIRDAFIVDAATAFTYKDKSATAQQVGRDLGVRFVLQGSVQRSGTVIRINAQLADTTSNAQLWTESFEGDQSDLFALYDKVTGRIGNSIGQEMIIIAGRESETRKSNPQAADLILRARASNLKPLSLKNYQHIETLFREALALDPNNTRAMIGVASALAVQAASFPGAFDEQAGEKKFAEARDFALKVNELDPNIPNIYFVLGSYALRVDDFGGARRAWETYFSLMPKSGYAYNNLAYSYLTGGEPKRAIELLTQAINLQPGGPGASQMSNLCQAHFMLGDNDGAIEWCLKSLAKNPDLARTHAFLAMAYSLKGDDAKARAAVAALRKLPPGHGLTDEFMRPKSSQPAAYKEWYEKKFLPMALKVGLWETSAESKPGSGRN